jgi:lysophospholipase L1-like esterase
MMTCLRKKSVFLFLFPSTSIGLTVTSKKSNTNGEDAAMRRFPPPKIASRVHRILAYGNSFIAGVSGTMLFPLAVYLEQYLSAALGPYDVDVTVAQRANPGWTTRGMLNTLDGKHVGLRSAIVKAARNAPSLSLVLIMAGSNDLPRSTASADSIANNLIQLHRVCLENGVPRTVAIGIPPSGYQAQNPEIAEKAHTVNNILQRYYAPENPNMWSQRTTFVPFPFAFVRRGKNWYPDDLHLTEAGYQALAKSLEPVVVQVLQSLDAEQQQQGSLHRTG